MKGIQRLLESLNKLEIIWRILTLRTGDWDLVYRSQYERKRLESQEDQDKITAQLCRPEVCIEDTTVKENPAKRERTSKRDNRVGGSNCNGQHNNHPAQKLTFDSHDELLRLVAHSSLPVDKFQAQTPELEHARGD